MVQQRKEERHFRKDRLQLIFNNAVGKTLGELDSAGVFDRLNGKKKVTGVAGDVVEQSILGLPPDCAQAPDIIVDGVPTELKATGLRISKSSKKLEAKEPMSITAVSLDRIAGETFENSNFWHKVEHMLIIYYNYKAENTVQAMDYAGFPIEGYQFHEFTPEDVEILQNDWQLVHDYVDEAQRSSKNEEELKDAYRKMSSTLRPNLSYIDLAPKYPNHPRFRLKRQVVTNISQGRKKKMEILDELKCVKSRSDFDKVLSNLTEQYSGWTLKEIAAHFGFKVKENKERKIAKSVSEQIIVRMFGGKNQKLANVSYFANTGLVGRSITITSLGKKTEDIKMLPVDFGEIQDESLDFEQSHLYEWFTSSQLVYAVFEEPSSAQLLTDNVFKGFVRVTFDDEFIEHYVKPVWDRLRELVLEGTLRNVPCLDKNGVQRITPKTKLPMEAPNFPKSKEGLVFLRGTGEDAKHKAVCINGVSMYKQDYWISGIYLANVVSLKLQEALASYGN